VLQIGPDDPRVMSRTRGPCRPKRASSDLPPQIEAKPAYRPVWPDKRLAGYFGWCQHASYTSGRPGRSRVRVLASWRCSSRRSHKLLTWMALFDPAGILVAMNRSDHIARIQVELDDSEPSNLRRTDPTMGVIWEMSVQSDRERGHWTRARDAIGWTGGQSLRGTEDAQAYAV
jgi:hypothetical protein